MTAIVQTALLVWIVWAFWLTWQQWRLDQLSEQEYAELQHRLRLRRWRARKRKRARARRKHELIPTESSERRPRREARRLVSA